MKPAFLARTPVLLVSLLTFSLTLEGGGFALGLHQCPWHEGAVQEEAGGHSGHGAAHEPAEGTQPTCTCPGVCHLDASPPSSPVAQIARFEVREVWLVPPATAVAPRSPTRFFLPVALAPPVGFAG